MLLSAPNTNAARRETPSIAPYLELAVAFPLVAFLAWAGTALGGAGAGAVPVWPANGLLLGLLLTSRPRQGSLYLLWGLLAYAASATLCGQPPALGLRLVAVNNAALLLAWTLLREPHVAQRPMALPEPADLWRFTLAAGLLAPGAATLLNALLLALARQDVALPSMASFFVAQGLGMVAVAPVALAARRGTLHLSDHLKSHSPTSK